MVVLIATGIDNHTEGQVPYVSSYTKLAWKFKWFTPSHSFWVFFYQSVYLGLEVHSIR